MNDQEPESMAEIPIVEKRQKVLNALIDDYQRWTAVGRTLWRLSIVIGGFLVGAAALLASIESFLSNWRAIHPQ